MRRTRRSRVQSVTSTTRSRVAWRGEGADQRFPHAASGSFDIGRDSTEPITSQQPDPENVDMQVVVANALYRSGRLRRKIGRRRAGGRRRYSGLRRRFEKCQAPGRRGVQLRIPCAAAGRNDAGPCSFKLPPGFGDPNGSAGSPIEPGDAGKFNIYVPLDKDERDKAGGAGKVAPIKRKG